MIKIIKLILVLAISFLFLSCGFKPLNKKGTTDIDIQNINIIGNQKIAYYLKNNIRLMSNKTSNNKYDIEIIAKKEKSNKIKDKTGKVKRYNLFISAELKLSNLESNNIKEKKFSRNQDYYVAKIHSDTITNERNATKNILQQLSNVIVNFITIHVRN